MIELPNRKQVLVTFQWLAKHLGISQYNEGHITAIDIDHSRNMLKVIFEDNTEGNVPETEEAPCVFTEACCLKRCCDD